MDKKRQPKPQLDSLREQKRLESKARTEQIELDNKVARGELVPMATAKKVLTDVLLPLRTALQAMPSALCARCNPGDPELARAALADACREILQSASDEAAKI